MDTKEPLLTPGEVAELFRVDPKTVTRWAQAGRISSTRTLGGHRRYRESEIRAVLQSGFQDKTSPSRLEEILEEEREERLQAAKLDLTSAIRDPHGTARREAR